MRAKLRDFLLSKKYISEITISIYVYLFKPCLTSFHLFIRMFVMFVLFVWVRNDLFFWDECCHLYCSWCYYCYCCRTCTLCRIFANQHDRKKQNSKEIMCNASNSIAHLTACTHLSDWWDCALLCELCDWVCATSWVLLSFLLSLLPYSKYLAFSIDASFTCHICAHFFRLVFAPSKMTNKLNRLFAIHFFAHFRFAYQTRLYQNHVPFYCELVCAMPIEMCKRTKCRNHFAILWNCQQSSCSGAFVDISSLFLFLPSTQFLWVVVLISTIYCK